MSKDIVIQESGMANELTVDKLKTTSGSRGTTLWVPEDGKNLVNIRIRQNGTYNASAFGAYGIAEARVACTEEGGAATATATSKTIDDQINVVVQEGGADMQFTCNRLKTTLQGGGECRWLSEASVRLGTISVDVDNKTYRASDDNKYGWSQVVVSGIGITKTTDDDGNEVVTHTDGSGTETEVVPSSIVIEKLPTFTGPYGNGAYIGFDGMVVKAYKNDGTVWTDDKHPNGVIRFDELILPVKQADIEQITEGSATSDLIDGTLATSLPPIIDYNGNPNARKHYLTGGTAAVVVESSGDPNRYWRIVASDSPFTWESYDLDTSLIKHNYISGSAGSSTFYGKTAYHYATNGPRMAVINAPVNPPIAGWREAAWTIIYGDVTPGGQIVPVQWERPLDNKLLETSFQISVIDIGPGGGHGED